MDTYGVEAVVVRHHQAHCRTIHAEVRDVKEQQPWPFLRLAMPAVNERVDGDGGQRQKHLLAIEGYTLSLCPYHPDSLPPRPMISDEQQPDRFG